jgi:uracil-DNA glycosylase
MTFPGAERYLPARPTMTALVRASATCQGCDLYQQATQVVFGAGRVRSRLMLVGEQPGDVEDRRGEPFVGPAGGVLDRALEAAGIAREGVYVTNAVKHFRWKPAPSSSRRLHVTPSSRQVAACRPWLAAELRAVRPDALIALGSVAAQTLFGPGFRLTAHRGEFLPWPPPSGPFTDDDMSIGAVLATIHPSAVLRTDPAGRGEAFDGLVADLRQMSPN